MSRRESIIGIVALAVFLVGYSFYWNGLSHDVEGRFAEWREQQTKAGATVKGETTVSGFPFSITLTTKNFVYDRPDAFRASVPKLMLMLRPWSPFRISSITEDNSQFHFYKMDYTVSVQNLSLTLARPLLRPHSAKDNGLFATLHLVAVGLDERQKVALGNLVQDLSFRAKIKGKAPDFLNKDEVDAWHKNGGMVELDRINLVWGSLNVNGKGNLSLDKNAQPAATFSTTVTGYEQAVDVLRDQGQVKPLVASVIKAALKMLEDPDAPPNAPKMIRVPVVIKDNALSVAGVNITNWSPYPW